KVALSVSNSNSLRSACRSITKAASFRKHCFNRRQFPDCFEEEVLRYLLQTFTSDCRVVKNDELG
ncbi:hypothetical protein NPIL_205571, partial [Nephila pilipes]